MILNIIPVSDNLLRNHYGTNGSILHWAVYYQRYQIVLTLLNDYNSNVTIVNNENENILYWCIDHDPHMNKNIDLLYLILLSINKSNHDISTSSSYAKVLELCIDKNRLDIIKCLLLMKKINIYIKDEQNRLPLSLALIHNKLNIFNWFLMLTMSASNTKHIHYATNKKLLLNDIDINHNTILHYATIIGNINFFIKDIKIMYINQLIY